jgi:hypothetical protein
MKKLIPLLILLFACGCASNFNSSAAKSLAVSNQIYDTTLSILADLYAQDMLSEEAKAKVIEIGTEYMAAHNLAVDALLIYIETGTDEDKDEYLRLSEAATLILQKLIDFAKPYLED